MAYSPVTFSGAFLDENADPIAGATVTITIRDDSGTALVTAAACTQRTGEGGSWYDYTYTPLAAGTLTGVMSTTAVTAVQSWLLVGTETVYDASAAAGVTAAEVWGYSTRTLTSPTLTFDSPFDGDTVTLTLIRGDDYTTGASNRPLQWSGTVWPVLTGGAITLLMRSVSAPADVLSFSGTVIDADTAQVQLTAAQTGALDVSSNRNQPAYEYALTVVLGDGGFVTLVRGTVNVRRTPTNL